MDFIILGIQGSGKGTQGRKLGEKYGYTIFEMGVAFRTLIKESSELANRVREIINKGNLVDDETVMNVFLNSIKTQFAEGIPDKMIYDGIPRRLGQKKLFDNWMAEQGREFRVIDIVISEDEAIKRLVQRRVCSQCGKPFSANYKSDRCDVCDGIIEIREDESKDAILTRIADFKKYTTPVLDEYREEGLLISINGEQSPENVFIEIENKINSYLN